MSSAKIIAQARVEADRFAAVLAVIADVLLAQERAQSTELSEAGECLALDALGEAEDRLIALITEPGFVASLAALGASFNDTARLGRILSESVS